MNLLAANFSGALLCVITAGAMMGTIFGGQANTTFRYIVSILIMAVAVVIFGVVSADIVQIIKVL